MLSIEFLIKGLHQKGKEAAFYAKEFLNEELGSEELFLVDGFRAITPHKLITNLFFNEASPRWIHLSLCDIRDDINYIQVEWSTELVTEISHMDLYSIENKYAIFQLRGPSFPPEYDSSKPGKFSIKESPSHPNWMPSPMYPERLQNMIDALKLLKSCGNYDTTIVGAIGEVYAEEILGMEKGARGFPAIDGWINGRAVQIKTKEIDESWLTKPLSQRYVQVSKGKEVSVDDLIVIMVHPERVWVHFYGAIKNLVPRVSKDKLRFHLHEMNGEGLIKHKQIIEALYFAKIQKKRRRIRNSFEEKTNSNDVRSEELEEINLNRPTIKRVWVNKNVLLNISDVNSDKHYKLTHADLMRVVQISAPNCLKSNSWLFGGVYSWPSISKKMRGELNKFER